jgi:hypothetical protein
MHTKLELQRHDSGPEPRGGQPRSTAFSSHTACPAPAAPLTLRRLKAGRRTQMRRTAFALFAGLAAAAIAAAPGSQLLAQDSAKSVKVAKKAAGKSANCALKRGRGWAPTEAMARFQAWEIVAQTTGNWPFKTDTFKNERYKCKPDPAGYVCDSWIDVCKS